MNATIPFPKLAPVPMPGQPASAGSATSGATGKKILIVDDSVVLLKLLSSKLRASGYQVFTAVDGSEAVSTVRRERPHLILLDINFPPDVAHGGGVAWDGFLIMNWLRRMDEAIHTPVIIITGTSPEESRDRCMKAGVSGYFQKPVNNEELLAAIAELLGPAAASEPAGQGTAGKTVLLVDDENDWRFMAGLYLKDAGFQVVTASHGAEAAEKLKTIKPGVVLLDLNLSGESGLEVMQSLKKEHPDLRIVLYTGMDHDKEAVEGMLRLGAYQYLRKGTMGDMLKAVQNAFPA
jgi:DNA-binding response OmpR family regulator